MDHDDALIGRLLTRREAVRLLGIAGAASLSGSDLLTGREGTATCVVRPELIEGPYFLDASSNRSDIRVDASSGKARDGVPLIVTLRVAQVTAGQCSPLPKALVHMWQCDAVGVYSGVSDPQIGSGNPQDNALRGTQQTDTSGIARFTTIYPGWYRGRAVHIHFKIRTEASGQAYEYTSQLFFPETLTDEIHALAPYAQHGRRDTMNERDMIYREAGEQLLLRPTKTSSGYEAPLSLALDLSDAAVGRSDAEGMRGRGGRGRGGRGRGGL